MIPVWHLWLIGILILTTIWALHQLFGKAMSKVKEYELWLRVLDMSFVGRFNWLNSGDIWMDSTSAKMMGLGIKEGTYPYSVWADSVEPVSVQSAQDHVAPSLTHGSRYSSVIEYKNGKTVLAIGTVSANGSKMMGFNIDITNQTLPSHTMSKASAIERDRLREALSTVTRERIEALVLGGEHGNR